MLPEMAANIVVKVHNALPETEENLKKRKLLLTISDACKACPIVDEASVTLFEAALESLQDDDYIGACNLVTFCKVRVK